MVIFINQIRMKIGVMFGSPETTTGGNALKFYASVRLDIRRIGAGRIGKRFVGNQTRVKVVKNKMAPPFKQVEFDIMYGEGVSKTGELVDLGVKAVSSRSRVHGSPITASVSARAVKTPSSACATILPLRMKSRWRCARMPAFSPTSCSTRAVRMATTAIWLPTCIIQILRDVLLRPAASLSDAAGFLLHISLHAQVWTVAQAGYKSACFPGSCGVLAVFGRKRILKGSHEWRE